MNGREERLSADFSMNDLQPLNEHTYVRLTVVRLWEDLPLVLLAGIVFGLLCTPAILLLFSNLFVPALIVGVLAIAPAWAGLLALAAEIAREGNASISVMLRSLPRFWARST
ncbi:MAG: hypothetical protein NTY23_12505, partial [Chloroflexi bacterium]|nr:hypothetical protein [Chloroflexota bacterium]